MIILSMAAYGWIEIYKLFTGQSGNTNEAVSGPEIACHKKVNHDSRKSQY